MKALKSSVLALTLALSIMTQAVAPKDAHALQLLNKLNDVIGSQGAGAVSLFCVILMPVCFLDEKSDQAGTVSVDHLRENGYSETEIQELLAQQATFAKKLQEKNIAVKVGAEDTRESLARDIRSVYPEASASYVNLVTESAGLAK